MKGPYTAKITISGETIEVQPEELREAEATAHRFYADASVGLVQGAERSACFYTAALLSPGESAEVEIWGFPGAGSYARTEDGGRASLRRNLVRRDEQGRCHMTLGSRFNERIWKGV